MLERIEQHYKANTDRYRIRDEPVNGAYLAIDRGKLTKYAYRMLGNIADAEDAVQDCYERVLRYQGSFKEGNDFDGWVFIILARVINRIRQGKSNEPELVEADDTIHIEEYLVEADTPEDAVTLIRWEQAFNGLCFRLSSRDVSVLELYFLYGHNMPEVSDLLELNIHTVRRIVFENRSMILGGEYEHHHNK